jgi:hypothetical protein
MRFSRIKILLLVLLVLPSFSGCGGSSSGGSPSDPLASGQGSSGGTVNTPPNAPPTGSGTVLNYALSLSTVGSSGSSTVGSNSTVIAQATLKDSNGDAVASQPIRFEEVATAPDASVTIQDPTVSTSSEGIATAFLQTGSANVNRDVIIKASTSIGGQTVSSVSIFKIVRSVGNYIDFISTKEITDPDGNMNKMDVSISQVNPADVPIVHVYQLVTLQVLDKNGLNRTSVPIILQIENSLGACSVTLKDTQSTTQTVTTDDTGLAIFSADVQMQTPAIGTEHSCSVVYKATTADPYTDGNELFSYGAYITTVTNEK